MVVTFVRLHPVPLCPLVLPIDVFGPLPATRGTAQAEEGDREPQKTERSRGGKIIPECPAMSGTTWEARLFLLRYGLSRREGIVCPWLSAPPPPPPKSPQQSHRGDPRLQPPWLGE